MTISRIIFKQSFTSNEIPVWSCPTCQKGDLYTEDKNLKTYENATSIDCHSHIDWEPEWINGIFIGLFKCSNETCQETVVLTGKFHCVQEYEFDHENDRFDTVLKKIFTPNCFTPAIHIFKINQELPIQIQNEIINSFSIFWVDNSSCANKIRVIVELILDNMKVPKTYLTSKNKRESHKLHKRIEFFKVTKPQEAELLMAIKWIGNSGSHSSNSLTKDDILDGFEILSHVTTILFETNSKRIVKLTKAINKRKKPNGNTKNRK